MAQDLLNRTTDSPIKKSRFRPKGQKPQKDEIIVNPPDTAVNEAKEKTAVMTFGRMNPPTVGHEKLLHKVADVAAEHGGSAHAFVSHSQDKKNPLEQSDKLKYVNKIAPKGVSVHGSSKEAPSILHAAKKLHDSGHQHLVVVAGEDRVDEYHRLLHKYNGHQDHYNFKSIKVVSAGHRDPDAEGVEGMSASKMRAHAAAGEHKEFKAGLPKALHPHAKEIMDKVRSGLGLKEENLNEVNIETRVKRAMNLRRYRAKIEQSKKRAQTRYATPYNIHKKALRYARMALKHRFAGESGKSYTDLPPAYKKAIDKTLTQKVGLVKQIASRIQPRVTAAELARMVSAEQGNPKSGTKSFFKGKIQMQSYDALAKKAEQNNIPVDVLVEVYNRGADVWNNDKKTPEQLGFDRVNSFISKGTNYYNEDKDLAEQALSYQQYFRISQLTRLGLVDDGDKQRLLTILNKMRNISDIDKLQLSDKVFLASLLDDVLEQIVDDNQLFNRMMYLLRRK